jgi:UDP-glucose 4-epimerase
MLMRSRYLITGAAGFVGQQLVKHLISKGEQVWAIDRVFYDFESDLVTFTQADVREMFLIDPDMFSTAKACIHLANKARIDPSWENVIEYYDTNIIGTVELFRRCQRDGVPTFLYVSSSSAAHPYNPYAISKASAEQTLGIYADTTKLVIARPYTMYGTTMATETNALAIGKFIHAYKNKKPIVVNGTGDQRRDFIHVDEAIQAMLLLLDKGQHKQTYDIGTGQSVSINEIAELFGSNRVIAPARPGPEYNTQADITKLLELGWEPKVRVLEWLSDQLKTSFKEFEC